MTELTLDLANALLAVDERAKYLNIASDQLSGRVARIEERLKAANCGVEAEVKIATGITLSYSKGPSGWGVHIDEGEETWRFKDAPRDLRVTVYPFLVSLLKQLEAEVDKMHGRIAEVL